MVSGDFLDAQLGFSRSVYQDRAVPGFRIARGIPILIALIDDRKSQHTVVLLALSLAAIKIDSRRFHAAFVIVALICEVEFILAAHLRF
jgi:hypothetical protein